MREAVGSTWIFGLVMSFTLIFSAFLVLALTYAKAYKIKNEMISIIEKYEGITTSDSLNNMGSLNSINRYLLNNNYTAKGTCEVGDYGISDLNSDYLEPINNSNSSNKYFYCVRNDIINKNCSVVFKIKIFYDFNLPVIGRLKKFSITGETNEIMYGFFQKSKITC